MYKKNYKFYWCKSKPFVEVQRRIHAPKVEELKEKLIYSFYLLSKRKIQKIRTEWSDSWMNRKLRLMWIEWIRNVNLKIRRFVTWANFFYTINSDHTHKWNHFDCFHMLISSNNNNQNIYMYVFSISLSECIEVYSILEKECKNDVSNPRQSYLLLH